jgi:ubiquinone/menaquinone biosynthesis C-methylase UbiE
VAFAASQAGALDRWPTRMRFGYFCGFVGGDAIHLAPRHFITVLDIGSGAGDVAMLAGRLVRPKGTVLGIERSAESVMLD